jgi:hypothetical protein
MAFARNKNKSLSAQPLCGNYHPSPAIALTWTWLHFCYYFQAFLIMLTNDEDAENDGCKQ